MKSAISKVLCAGAVLVSLMPVAAHAKTDEIGLTPKYWCDYEDDTWYSSIGSSALNFTGYDGGWGPHLVPGRLDGSKALTWVMTWGSLTGGLKLPFTLMTCVKLPSDPQYNTDEWVYGDRVMISLGHAGYPIIGIKNKPDYKIAAFYTKPDNTTIDMVCPGLPGDAKDFHLYALTCKEDGTADFFVDGTLVGSYDKSTPGFVPLEFDTSNGYPYFQTGGCYYGARTAAYNCYFQFTDDFRIYDRVLSAADIASLANGMPNTLTASVSGTTNWSELTWNTATGDYQQCETTVLALEGEAELTVDEPVSVRVLKVTGSGTLLLKFADGADFLVKEWFSGLEVANGVTLNVDKNTSDKTIGAAITVDEGAALAFNNDFVQITFNGAITNNGTIVKGSATGGRWVLNGPVVGNGAFTGSNGWLFYLASGLDLTEFTGSLGFAGGSLNFGDTYGRCPPVLPPLLETLGTDWGSVTISASQPWIAENGAYDEILAKSKEDGKWVYLYSRDAAASNIVRSSTWEISRLSIGSPYDMGVLRVDDGATVNVYDQVLIGDINGYPKQTMVDVREGGVFNYLGSDETGFRVGYWTLGYTPQNMEVNGGTVTASNALIVVGWGSNRAFLTLNDGTITTKGMRIRAARNWDAGVDEANNDERFIQNGGVLEIGASGFSTVLPKARTPYLNLNGGKMLPLADFSLPGSYFWSVFGEDPANAGTYEIDLNGKTVSWNNALYGASEVRLTGESGTFTSPCSAQGVPTGKWIVASSGITADLLGAAGFAGGLELVENASARINIASASLVGAFFGNYDELDKTNMYVAVATALDQINAKAGATEYEGICNCYRGQFYVDEDKAGTWYFAGIHDDRLVTFEIDGVKLMETWNYNTVGTCSAELGAGWHDFHVAVYNGGSPNGSWWSDSSDIGLGWTLTDPAGSTDCTKYTKFDTTTLKMRIGAENTPQLAGVGRGGLGGVTTLAAGSRLVNAVTDGACPIYGTLEGSGALVGRFAFDGGTWRVKADAQGITEKVAYDETLCPDFMKGLAAVEIEFSEVTRKTTYRFCPAGTLTDEDAAKIAVSVTGPKGTITEGWRAVIKNGWLCLNNPNLSGLFIFVR